MKKKKSLHSLFFELGLALMLFTLYGVYNNFDSEKWLFVDWSSYRIVDGKILSSEKRINGIYGGWRFYIQYEYYVGNIKLISNRVHFGYQAMSDKSYAQGYVDKYPVGKKVSVYYNPDNPKESVLEPRIKWFGQLYFDAANILLSLVLLSLSAYYKVKSVRAASA